MKLTDASSNSRTGRRRVAVFLLAGAAIAGFGVWARIDAWMDVGVCVGAIGLYLILVDYFASSDR